MPFHIRDPKTLDLVDQVMLRFGVKTGTEAVRMALENELKRLAANGHERKLSSSEASRDNKL